MLRREYKSFAAEIIRSKQEWINMICNITAFEKEDL